MIFYGKEKVKLTRSELLRLQEANAEHSGRNLGPIQTLHDYLDALLGGLPDEILYDMLEYFETGSSELTQLGEKERANRPKDEG